MGLFGSGARGKPGKAGGQEPASAGQVEATWLGGAVTRMGQAALRPLGVGQRRMGQSWYCWAGEAMVWGLVLRVLVSTGSFWLIFSNSPKVN